MTDQKSSADSKGQFDVLQSVLDTVPGPAFLIDIKLQVEMVNQHARERRNLLNAYTHRERMGNILGCINALSCPEGCGGTRNCADCPIRRAVADGFDGKNVFREKAIFQLLVDGEYEPIRIWLTAAPIRFEERDFVVLILEDIAEFIQSTGIMPVCASCGKVSDDQGPHESLDAYVGWRYVSDFKHALCPDCAQETPQVQDA